MNLPELPNYLRKNNVALITDGTSLKVYPAEALTPELQKALTVHREKVIQDLLSHSSTPGNVLYKLCTAVRFVHEGREYGGCEKCRKLPLEPNDTKRPQDFHLMQFLASASSNPGWLKWSCEIGYIREDDAVLRRWLTEAKEIPLP